MTLIAAAARITYVRITLFLERTGFGLGFESPDRSLLGKHRKSFLTTLTSANTLPCLERVHALPRHWQMQAFADNPSGDSADSLSI